MGFISMIQSAKPMIGGEEKKAILDVIDSGMLVQGPKVKELEDKFAKYTGAKYAVAVNSGTAGLHTALYAAGIKPGDEVITTPFTFAATANSILMQNAKVVFADIDNDTFNISPEEVRKKLTRNTKAVIAVDLYGQTHDFDGLRAVLPDDVKIIEDACQSLGAEHKGRKAGILGDIGIFSLYATKNITSVEGGMIVTDNEEYFKRARTFRNHGQNAARYEYLDVGYNYRMCDLLAAIGIEQMKKLQDFINKRRENAQYFIDNLQAMSNLRLPMTKKGNFHVYNQFTLRVDKEKRAALVEHLKKNGISAAIYYPTPLHVNPAFSKFGFKKGDFPVAEKIAEEVLSIPVHPALSKRDLDKVVKAINEFEL